MDKIRAFFHSPIAGGTVLILCTIVALTLSHIPATSEWYANLWDIKFTLGFENFGITHTIKEWINDALMAVFFFAVGLEIKREIVSGQLKSIRQASLPIAAAIGGMLAPALIYVAFNQGLPTVSGWGIPMATDIAFALGVLSLFSNRVPVSLKIFLTALAIVDDLGAILVIAIFYSSSINFVMLLLAALVFAYLMVLNKRNVHSMRMYLIPAIVLWVLFLNSGVHATIAGVLIAMTIPSVAKFPKRLFDKQATHLVKDYNASQGNGHAAHKALQNLRVLARNTISPIERLEHALHSPVNFFIMPIFALANAGVVISMADLPQLIDSQGLGIILGLVLGKPIGILLFSFLVIKLGLSRMPAGATWRKLLGVGCLGGIGFTMSIFIDMLAFSDPVLVGYGKMAILTASILAGILGSLVLLTTEKNKN